MKTNPEKLAHLERLRDVLAGQGFVVEVVSFNTKPYLTVANAQTPQLNERVLCEQDADGSWCYWWPWRRPIGSVDELETVTGKIASVLRPVEGES